MTRRLAAAAIVTVSALALAGCGTGLQAQTYQQKPYRDFADTSVGDLKIRNLGISPPAEGTVIEQDGTAVLTGTVVNTGTTADALTGASTPVATSALLQVDGVDVASVPVPSGSDSGTSWAVVLSGLSGPVTSGQYVDVTLTFEKAGKTQALRVPVRSGDTGLEDREEAQDPYHVGGE